MYDRLQLLDFAARNSKLDEFAKFLKSENAKYNLTAITEEAEIVSKHFYDSLVGERFLEEGANVCDIGICIKFALSPKLKVVSKEATFFVLDWDKKICYFPYWIKVIN